MKPIYIDNPHPYETPASETIEHVPYNPVAEIFGDFLALPKSPRYPEETPDECIIDRDILAAHHEYLTVNDVWDDVSLLDGEMPF